MDNFTGKILKHKKAVVIMSIILAVVFALLATRVKVNYTLADYLPEDAESTVALNVMQKEFSEAVPNERVMVKDVTVTEALSIKEKIMAIPGVENVMWLDDIVSLKIPVTMLPDEVTEMYYKDGNALFQVTVEKGKELPATREIYNIIGDNPIDGEGAANAAAQGSSVKESLNAMMALTPIVIIILLIMSSSWIEPVLFLAAIGISVLINMGTNVFLGEVSYITQSISPILQMAVSLDYAIFLLHCFENQRQEIEDVNLAMVKAVKQAMPSVAASAATTLFGFMALMLMRFEIGRDLGLNLVKGIIFSYLSVMIFLPALTLLCCNLIDKTRHKALSIKSKSFGRFLLKLRIPFLIIIVLLVVPSYMAQSRSDFVYGAGEANVGTRLGKDTQEIISVYGQETPVVILTPGKDVAKEKALVKDLENLESTTSVLSYTSAVGNAIPSDFLNEDISGNFYSDNYTRIIVNGNTKTEGKIAFNYIKDIRLTLGNYYDTYVPNKPDQENVALITGPSAVVYDMKHIVESDTPKVNGAAIIAIAIVLLLTFKSIAFIIPLILLFIIESAIWINLSIPYFTGMSLVYIGFLVINTVQLGATIDYAIFFTNNYMNNRKHMYKKDAILSVLNNNLLAILTSALILASAGICLKVTSSNSVVADLGLLLGRGTILSFLFVALGLPALLLIFDKLIGLTTIHSNFYKGEEKNEN